MRNLLLRLHNRILPYSVAYNRSRRRYDFCDLTHGDSSTLLWNFGRNNELLFQQVMNSSNKTFQELMCDQRGTLALIENRILQDVSCVRLRTKVADSLMKLYDVIDAFMIKRSSKSKKASASLIGSLYRSDEKPEVKPVIVKEIVFPDGSKRVIEKHNA